MTNSPFTRYDDIARKVYEHAPDATIISERDYTEKENEDADIRVDANSKSNNKSTIQINLEQDLAIMQAIKDQTNAELREDPSQEIKELAVAVRRLIKMSLNDFSEAE